MVEQSELRGLLAVEHFDPLREMIAIAKHPKASLDLRGKMCAELAGYVYAKRKQVEHTGDRPGNTIQLVVMQAGSPHASAAADPEQQIQTVDIKALIQE